MIRFSAFLVVVAFGLLVAGVHANKLLLVYLAIGVSGVALLSLGIGAAVKWREFFGTSRAAAPDVPVADPVPAQAPEVPVQASKPVPAGASAAQARSGSSATKTVLGTPGGAKKQPGALSPPSAR